MTSKTFDDGANRLRLAWLQDSGVEVWGPDRVYIGDEVPLDAIEPGATIYHATLSGKNLRIGKGSSIGRSGHALVEDCRIGRDVELGAGSYSRATILDGSKVRGFAELRPGTLLEEDCEAAHSVAFKNTILTATCVTGSLINYCDVFMTGGTSRSDHSEVGSGVVHFNFDPRGDKWGSLLGDARGLLLRSAPIFIGGQAGLVGPLHVDFGAVLAAGSIARRDIGPDRVRFEGAEAREVEGFDRNRYGSLAPKLRTTARLIGNLWAFWAWYQAVRLPFADDREKPLYESAQNQARVHIEERVKRLRKIVEKLAAGAARSPEHEALIASGEDLAAAWLAPPDEAPPPSEFLQEYEAKRGAAAHIDAVRGISPEAAEAAAGWLRKIAERATPPLDRALTRPGRS